MSWIPRCDRLLWVAAVVLACVGLLGWFSGYEIWMQYSQHLPRFPNAAAGSIYPLNVHGIVVYQTSKQRSFLQNWDFWFSVVCVCAAALGGIYEWRSRKRKAR